MKLNEYLGRVQLLAYRALAACLTLLIGSLLFATLAICVSLNGRDQQTGILLAWLVTTPVCIAGYVAFSRMICDPPESRSLRTRLVGPYQAAKDWSPLGLFTPIDQRQGMRIPESESPAAGYIVRELFASESIQWIEVERQSYHARELPDDRRELTQPGKPI